MLKEFKKFAVKGNVIDMAVGIIIGTAFTKIVNSLVSDMIMPPLGILLGGIDFSNFSLTLKEAGENSEAVILNYGVFINTLLDFFVIAFVIFIMIRQINRLKTKQEEQHKDAPSPSEDILLLREIRDSLKKEE